MSDHPISEEFQRISRNDNELVKSSTLNKIKEEKKRLYKSQARDISSKKVSASHDMKSYY
jgi:hypothetical protein